FFSRAWLRASYRRRLAFSWRRPSARLNFGLGLLPRWLAALDADGAAASPPFPEDSDNGRARVGQEFTAVVAQALRHGHPGAAGCGDHRLTRFKFGLGLRLGLAPNRA